MDGAVIPGHAARLEAVTGEQLANQMLGPPRSQFMPVVEVGVPSYMQT